MQTNHEKYEDWHVDYFSPASYLSSRVRFAIFPNLQPVDPVLPEVDGQGLQSPLEPREEVFLVAEVTDDIILVQRLVGDVSADVRDLLSFVVGLCGKSKEIQC